MKPLLIVIDDNPEDRDWLADTLENAVHMDVRGFATGSEGLAFADKRQADCIVLDYRRESDDGLAVLARIREEGASARVATASGKEQRDIRKRLLERRASALAKKSGNDNEAPVKAGQTVPTGGMVADAAAQQNTVAPQLILLIEDNPDDREYIGDLILDAFQDAFVDAVATGAEALEKLGEQVADCVILDHRLEVESGLEVLEKISRRFPHLPIIMLTGQGDEEFAARCIKQGASEYLAKGRLNKTRLKLAIENAINRAALAKLVVEQEDARRQFLRVLVHDLRAPLRNINMMGDLVERALAAGDMAKLETTVSHQTAAAGRAADLLDSLAIYALLDQEVAIAPVSLTRIAEEARDNLSLQLIERNAVVRIGRLPEVNGNAPQLIQLFQNLISNGVKYNDSSAPEVVIESGDTGLSVSVRDNGIGIPSDQHKVIFAPLKRLWGPSDYPGTGLGLAICEKVMDRHGGRIRVVSEPGKGATFQLQFKEGRPPD